MADNFKFVQVQDLYLAGNGVGLNDTTIILSSFTYVDGTDVVMSDFGDIGYATLEPNTVREENISFTGITQNLNGTATLTGVTRGLKNKSPYDADNALKSSHSGSALVVISNSAAFYNELTGKDNDETVTGDWIFNGDVTLNGAVGLAATSIPTFASDPTINDDKQVATKKYVDTSVVSGAPIATTTAKGIVEIATDAELAAGTATGSTGASVVAAGGSFKSTATANKVPVADASGKLSAGWGGSASTLATLDSNTLVVENPANATATPTASKIVVADGSGKIDDGWLSVNSRQSLEKSFTAGVNLTEGDVVSLGIASEILASSNTDDSTQIGQTTNQYRSMLFTTSNKIINLRSVSIKCDSNDGSGNHTVTLSIREVSGGLPTGSDLGSKSATFTIAPAYKLFTFASPITLSANTTYAIVVKSAQTLWWYGDGSSGTGVGTSTNGSSWSTVANQSRSYKIYETQTVAGRAYKSNALQSNEYSNNVIGIVNSTVTAGNSASVTLGGVSTHLTGLTAGTTYYLSDTDGALSSSAGTVSRKVGLALSTTELLLKQDNP